ncbi:MAG TPA: MarR family transcriptional regulator [Acidimicrobiales bacterium]|nr:MarR family transcriptional regulator [Acidimicrobiales bacterium]
MTDAPVTRFSYVVKRLEAAVRAHLDVICREHDVTTMQYVALSVLRVHPGMSSAQLASRSFVSPQSANQMVAALERAGLIEREPRERNRRVLEISLTDKGIAMLDACEVAVDEFEERMLRGLGEPAMRSCRQTMNACIRNLSVR